MENTIVKYLLDNSPGLAIVVILLYLAIIITWKGSRYHHDIQSKFKAFDNLQETADANSNKLEKIITILTKVGHYVASQKNSGFKIDDFIVANSPYQLSAIGNEFLIKSGAEYYLKNNFLPLLDKVKQKNPKNGLDLENDSIAILNDFSDTDTGFEPLKKFLYNNPIVKLGDEQKEYSVNLQTLIIIMSIWLRDKYYDTYHDGVDGDFTPKSE